jgi:hypothetical protein
MEELRKALETYPQDAKTMNLFASVGQTTADVRVKLLYIDHVRHYTLDEDDIDTAFRWIHELRTRSDEFAGAALVLDYLIRDHRWEIGAEEARRELEQSVALAPNWVLNRRCLAEHLEGDDVSRATRELEVALSNLLSFVAPHADDWISERFEIDITQRSAKWLEEDIRRDIAGLQARSK